MGRDAISVEVVDQSATRRATLQLPTDMMMRHALPILTAQLGLPAVTLEGRPIEYVAITDGRALRDDETLDNAEVPQGAQITLTSLFSEAPRAADLSSRLGSTGFAERLTARAVFDTSKLNRGSMTALSSVPQASTASGSDVTALLERILLPQFEKSKNESDARLADLEARVRQLEMQLQTQLPPKSPPAIDKPPEVDFLREVVLIVTHTEGHQTFSLSGEIHYIAFRARALSLNVPGWNNAMEAFVSRVQRSRGNAGIWRPEANRQGQQLFSDVFTENPELMNMLGQARQAVRPDGHVTYCFRGPRDHLAVPYELLHEGGQPLVTVAPVCRQVQVEGVAVNGLSFDRFLLSLRDPLRVLLLQGNSDHAGAEVELVSRTIEACAARAHLSRPEIRTLAAGECTFDGLTAALRHCAYHIVHFAGSAEFDSATGEDSSLIWRDPGPDGAERRLTASTVQNLMNGSKTVLFYLGAGGGAAVADLDRLNTYANLGLVDGLIMAGVPCVVAFRWKIDPNSMRSFSNQFYESLFESRSPERAVLQARQSIYKTNTGDDTWASAMLVVQSPR